MSAKPCYDDLRIGMVFEVIEARLLKSRAVLTNA
jgi:hypothetical protein